jgi:hypothetical protein
MGGATPARFQASWASYWWLGDEERGLAGFCESDEAWDRVDRQDGFRIERAAGSVNAIWAFVASPRKLDKPWRFTFGIQATPVKDTTGFRKLRFEPGLRANVTIPWPTPKTIRHYGYPEATDSHAYQAMVNGLHTKGIKASPYSLLNYLSAGAPEAFYSEEWASGETWPAIGDVGEFGYPMIGCIPTRDWVAFVLWKNERFVREMDLDGLYHDFTWPSTCTRPDEGFGYIREGAVRAKVSIFGVREMYKRIYTMLKQYGRQRDKEMLMIGHTSSPAFIPLMSLCDACLAGEQFIPTVKDNYLDVISLAQLRAEFTGRNLGVVPVFLPELKPEFQKAPPPTENLVGLALLHDFLLYPLYAHVLDDFGVVEAQRLPYWNNADVIAGQTEAVKCTAYHKPGGSALVCIFNTKRARQTTALTIDWDRLKSPGPLQVTDAFTKECVRMETKTLEVEVPPINFRLLWVR